MTASFLDEAESALKVGRPADAIALAMAVLEARDSSPQVRRRALLLRSQGHEELGDLPQAIADLHEALAINRHDARTHNRLGILLADSGDTTGSIEAFSAAVEADPAHGRAWNNLGNTLRAAGRLPESMTALRRAVSLHPDNVFAWSNLGVVSRELGDSSAAIAALQKALTLAPDHRPALIALSGTLRALGRIDEAAFYYAHAARLDASDRGPLEALAGIFSERDDLALARGAYGALRAARPQSLRAAFGEALTLPMVNSDRSAIDAVRAEFASGLAELESSIESLVCGRTFADVVNDLCWTNFLLAYHGEDDRDLQARFAALVARAIDLVAPEWRAERSRSKAKRRIRVGFVSAFFLDCTVGRYFKSWVTGLDRAHFEIYVYHLHVALTPFAQELGRHADRMRSFRAEALRPSMIAPVIRDDDLDILVYPELGMDATTFVLAAMRLAPVQCAGWGHPVTTGHATIDAFLSCAAMEPPGADAQYTERLVLLPGIGTTYSRPAIPSDAHRSRLGLPEGAVLFLCPQSLFKVHPDNDELFARVLAATPAARMVVFAGRHPALTSKYRRRFALALSRFGLEIDERLIVIPQCGHDDYLRINRVCDVMLDTMHWSGGNTSLDALACGLPILTLPGRFMRGRQSAGMLRLMGMEQLIATDKDDYVRLAGSLARDSNERNVLASKIDTAHGRVFDDPGPVVDFATFLCESAAC